MDLNLLTAKDFIGVRAALVRELGGDANRALVLSRTFYRSDELWREAIERDGQWWWRATYQTIADETGLSAKQVERCLKWLVDGGYLSVAKHNVDGRYDQTRSYRVNVDFTEPGDDSPESGNVDSPESGNVPLLQTDIKTLTFIKTADGSKTTAEIDAAFDRFWNVYPRHVAKIAARKSFVVALKSTPLASIMQGAEAYRRAMAAAQQPVNLVAHPTTWLNGGRWDDDLGPTVGTGIQSIRSL